MMLKQKVALVVMLGLSSTAFAKDSFSIILDSEGQQVYRSFKNIEDVFDAAKPDFFAKSIIGYDDNSAAVATLDIRGIKVISNYAANSSEFVFEIPALGIRKVFHEMTRAESEKEFRDYLKKNGDGILSQILGLMVETTALDPVAGNPDSLMGSMVDTDYNAAIKDSNNSNDDQQKNHQFNAGIEAGHYTVDGNSKNIFTLPLAYTYHFDKPGYRVKLTAPISYMDVNGSKAYKGSLGAALRVPVTDKWSLTPALRVGAAASKDMGSAAIINSTSLTSVYNTRYKDVNLSIANMANVLKTSAIKSGDYKIDYDLSNQIYKNGVTAEFPVNVNLLGKPLGLEASLANTKVTGDEVYIDNYNDLAVSLGSRKKSGGSADAMRLGLTYTKGNHGYQGVKLNFGYTF